MIRFWDSAYREILKIFISPFEFPRNIMYSKYGTKELFRGFNLKSEIRNLMIRESGEPIKKRIRANGVLCEVGFVTRRGGSFSDHETPYFFAEEGSQEMTKSNQTTKIEPETAARWVIATEGEGMTEEEARNEAKQILNLHPDRKLYLCEIREEISIGSKRKRQ